MTLTKERIIITTMIFNKIDKRMNIGSPTPTHTLQTRRQTSEENKIYEKHVKSADEMTSVFIRTRLLEYDNQIISDFLKCYVPSGRIRSWPLTTSFSLIWLNSYDFLRKILEQFHVALHSFVFRDIILLG